jgi:hypothetical protein
VTVGVELVGGRYDGMDFAGADGWVPGDEYGVLYLSTQAMGSALPPPTPTTTTGGVSYSARPAWDPLDVAWHRTEPYLRCGDGRWRTPKMAAVR